MVIGCWLVTYTNTASKEQNIGIYGMKMAPYYGASCCFLFVLFICCFVYFYCVGFLCALSVVLLLCEHTKTHS